MVSPPGAGGHGPLQPGASAGMLRAMPAVPESPSLVALRNLGPASSRMLAAAGIATPEALRALGSVAAYAAVQRAGQRPSLNLLWALEGALADRDWRDIAQHERTALLMQLDDRVRSEN